MALANAPATTGTSCVCHAPSQLPKALQPGGESCRAPGGLTFPFLVGLGRQLGNDHADFKHYDFPKLATLKGALVDTWRARDDAALIGEMYVVLKALAGEEGVKAVAWFLAGGGARLTHGPGSPLSKMAAGSWQFVTNLVTVVVRIREGVKKLAAGGRAPDFSALRVAVPATHWGLKDFPREPPTKLANADTTLKAILGGTQGEELWATSLKHDRSRRSWEMGLRWVILDHFGVGDDDLYAPGLIPFWVLQHERKGYRPYVNEVVVETRLSGTY